MLTVLAGSLLICFSGVTDKLIPLFAIGAFLAFTLSQAGMVMHWSKSKDRNARLSAVVNGTGAIATAITFLIVIVTKFTDRSREISGVPPIVIVLILELVLSFKGDGRWCSGHAPAFLPRVFFPGQECGTLPLIEESQSKSEDEFEDDVFWSTGIITIRSTFFLIRSPTWWSSVATTPSISRLVCSCFRA